MVPADAVAPRFTVPGPQLEPGVMPVIVGIAFMVILFSLSIAAPAGLSLTTLIRYPVPVGVESGIVVEIVPAETELKVPISTGDAKPPLASDS